MYRAITFFGQSFQTVPLGKVAYTTLSSYADKCNYLQHHTSNGIHLYPKAPINSKRKNLCKRNTEMVWTAPLSFATTHGIPSIESLSLKGGPWFYRQNFFLFLQLLRCFTSLGSLHIPYVFRYGYLNITSSGLPHSDIPGSKVACHLTETFRRLLRPSSSFDV